MKKILILFLAAAIVICAAGRSFCQDNGKPKNIQTASGLIRQVDWTGETITVNFINQFASSAMPFAVSEETVFPVPEDTEIRKGSDTIELSDLKVGDPVTIQYYRDSSGVLNIVSIDVNI